MSTPLWYRVYNKTLSFNEFLDRFNDKQFQDRDVLPIFIFAVLYNHEPYIKGSHILNYLILDDGLPDRSLKYFYIYWALKKDFGKESRLANSLIGGDFSGVLINLDESFSSDYLNDWMGIILRACFGIGCYLPGVDKNVDTIKYSKLLIRSPFNIPNITPQKMDKLAMAHNNLLNLINFFKTTECSNYIIPSRKNLGTFKNIVTLYNPIILKSCEPFNDLEMKVIQVEHTRLFESEDVNFFLYYIQEFIKVFPKEHTLTEQINKYLEISNEMDASNVSKFLSTIDPIKRQKYIPQRFPVINSQLESFIHQIHEKGFVSALMPYLLQNKKIFELELGECELVNDVITSSQYSIYLYPMNELILHKEENKIYVFLAEELVNFEKRENPYNRKSLPLYLYNNLDRKTENLEEIWTKILRRNICLEI